MLIKDNKTQPIFDYSECLFERVFVETNVDTDKDGLPDLIAVYIRRPKETANGLKVPVIYVANPYMHLCNDDYYNNMHDVNKNLSYDTNVVDTYDTNIKYAKKDSFRKASKEVDSNIVEEIPLDCITDWYSYFNCRGYATVFSGGLGTKYSQGYTLTGSKEETLAFKAVIDWLNGKANAFVDIDGTTQIKANWCTGNIAMTGKSYLATMCTAVACTGVEGLKTIIPVAGISSWYDYYRTNGLCVSPFGWQGDDIDILSKYCFSRQLEEDFNESILEDYLKDVDTLLKDADRDSGNYNKFWDDRNYKDHLENMKASAFIVHGLNDLNVKMTHFYNLFEAMKLKGLNVKGFLHQGDHIYTYNFSSGNFTEIIHKWLDYHLYGIENDALNIPNLTVQSSINQLEWFEEDDWYVNTEKLNLSINNTSFVDNPILDNTEDWLGNLISKENSFSTKTISDDFVKDTRLVGKQTCNITVSIDKPTAIISVMLVDIGEDTRYTCDLNIVEKDKFVWGTNTPKDNMVEFKKEEIPSKYKVISRGWMNVSNYESNWYKKEIKTNEPYELEIDLIPNDYIVKKGHNLAFIVYGTDYQETTISNINTIINILNAKLTLNVKI